VVPRIEAIYQSLLGQRAEMPLPAQADFGKQRGFHAP